MSARRIHPFPARMAPDIALDAIPVRADETLQVLDPMCGSGTVLSAALERGHDAVGIDIDPLAVMMSTLAVTRIDSAEMLSRARDVVASARTTPGFQPWGDDDETANFVDYWFAEKQQLQLKSLLSAISAIHDLGIQLALRMAVSRIIITKSSQASLAQDTSHSRPHRVRTESDYDVYEGFTRSATQLARMLENRALDGHGSVKIGDARDLRSVANSSIDLAVTSPPYLNALDYLRGHKLALVWFGHTISELRRRRAESIGSEKRMSETASQSVIDIVDIIESEASDKTSLKRPMIERFAHDCIGFAGQLAAKIKPGGTAVLVVGNSTLRGNYIKNDLIAQRAMEGAEFSMVSRRVRPIPSTSRYMAISTESTLAKRMRDEVVLTMVR